MKDIKILEIMELFDEDEVTTADQIDRPQSALDREMFQDASERFNKADGGMLVQPSADGSRPGYRGDSVEPNIRLRENGNAYDVEVKRGPQIFRKSFNLKDYKNKEDALKAAQKFKKDKLKIPFKTGIQEPMFGSRLDKKEYMRKYHEKTRTLTEAGKLAKERDLKLKNFIGKKKKINASTLRDFVIDELGYDNYSASRIKQKFPNLEIVKDIKTGTDFKPLNKKQIEIVKENFDLPEGVEKWNFKQYKNGISAAKHPNLFAQIQRRLNDKNTYKVAANFSDPQGWMISAMNRLYENETTLLEDGTRVLKKGVDKLTYEPKFNKKGIIVGFKDNTAAGDGKIYYGTKKAFNEYGDGTEWRLHGDFGRVSKFLDIANGVRAEPNKILQKILTQKGINVPGLTLNDVLSHKRYYNVLSDTAPRALLNRQIVLHHIKGVGDQNLARAAATKDIQLLTDEINSKVMKLENIVKGTSITPGRKLTKDEILKLKNYGAKIQDFDGKVVGGGFRDPTTQFASIEKGAIDYAKSDQFNVKTVASYLERLGCGKAAGGRVFYNEGAFGLTKCAEKGRNKLEKIIKSGAIPDSNDAKLATQILRAGRSLGSAFTLSGLFGPAAIAFTAAAEAGIVGYDMLTTGKTFKETIGDSLFNYALGEKTKIDPNEELLKRFSGLGYSDEQLGKFANVLNQTNTLNTILKQDLKVGNLKDQVKAFREQPRDQFMLPDDEMLQTDTAIRAEQKLKDEQKNLENLLINYRSQPPVGLSMEDTILGDMASGKFQDTKQDLNEAIKAAEIQKLESSGPVFMGKVFPKFEEGRQEDLLNLRAVNNPAVAFSQENQFMYPFGLAGGGIAKLAGIDEGPQTVSMNPDSQGLQSLKNRVKNI